MEGITYHSSSCPTQRMSRPSGCSTPRRWSGFAIQTRPGGCSICPSGCQLVWIPTRRMSRPSGCSFRPSGCSHRRPLPTQRMFHAVPLVWIPTYRMSHAVPLAPTPRMFVSCRWSGFAIQTR